MNNNYKLNLGQEWTQTFSSADAIFYIHSRTLKTSGTVSCQVGNLGVGQTTMENANELRRFVLQYVSSQGCGSVLREESSGKTSDGEFTVYAIEDEAKLETRVWFVMKRSEYALVVYMNSEGADSDEVAHIQRAVMASQFESRRWWKLW